MPLLCIEQKNKPNGKVAHRDAQASGFSLFEMSIAVTIIAFLTGAILFAQTMIEQSVLKKDLSQIQEVITAMNTFESKYGYLPGDLPNHANFFKTPLPGGYTGGDGDGRVGIMIGVPGGYTAYCAAGCADQGSESTIFWLELAETSLFKQRIFPFTNIVSDVDSFARQGIGYPAIQNGYQNGLAITSTPSEKKNLLIYGANQQAPANQAVTTGSSMFSDFSRYIDSKVDDGKPNTGLVQNRWNLGDAVTPQIAVNCNDGGNTYPHTNTKALCTLRIETKL